MWNRFTFQLREITKKCNCDRRYYIMCCSDRDNEEFEPHLTFWSANDSEEMSHETLKVEIKYLKDLIEIKNYKINNQAMLVK